MTNAKNVPEIRFKGFVDAWEQRKLGEVSSHRGGTAIEKYFSEKGKYKVISIGSYNINSEYNEQNLRALSNEITDKRVVKANELTMVLNDKTSTGEIIGRCLLINSDDEYVVNQRTEIIALGEMLDPQFAYTSINGPFREKIKKIVQGGTQIYVNYTAVENLIIEFPIIEEQAKIGEFFKALDNTIALHQRKLDQLKTLKQGYLQQLFPQKGEKLPRIRFANFDGEWEERKLGDIYIFLKGKGLPLDSFTKNKKSPAIAYGHLYTLYPEVIREVKLSSSGTGVFSKRNDILFPGSSTVPNGTAQANALMIDRIILGGDIIIAREKINRTAHAPYISYQINYQKYKLYPIIVGTTISHMYSKDLKKIRLSIPSQTEQRKVSIFFEYLDHIIALQQNKIDKFVSTKKAYLQKMFI